MACWVSTDILVVRSLIWLVAGIFLVGLVIGTLQVLGDGKEVGGLQRRSHRLPDGNVSGHCYAVGRRQDGGVAEIALRLLQSAGHGGDFRSGLPDDSQGLIALGGSLTAARV